MTTQAMGDESEPLEEPLPTHTLCQPSPPREEVNGVEQLPISREEFFAREHEALKTRGQLPVDPEEVLKWERLNFAQYVRQRYGLPESSHSKARDEAWLDSQLGECGAADLETLGNPDASAVAGENARAMAAEVEERWHKVGSV